MKRKQSCILELEPEGQDSGSGKNPEFIKNFQTAVLLSLLKGERLTKRQFDCCLDQLEKQQKHA